jgi:hypothetical protein
MYARDWLTDPALRRCAASTRGIWMDILCTMWLDGATGKWSVPKSDFARVAGCTDAEAAQFFADESAFNFCDMRCDRNGTVTLLNRRMSREAKARKGTALRQARFRRNGESNAPVTPMSQDTASASASASAKREEREAPSLPAWYSEFKGNKRVLDCVSQVRLKFFGNELPIRDHDEGLFRTAAIAVALMGADVRAAVDAFWAFNSNLKTPQGWLEKFIDRQGRGPQRPGRPQDYTPEYERHVTRKLEAEPDAPSEPLTVEQLETAISGAERFMPALADTLRKQLAERRAQEA